MNRGIITAIKWFEEVRMNAKHDMLLKEQAQRQSDRDPWYGSTHTQDARVAPLQGRLNTTVEGECSCQAVCPSCIDYQMTLNQAH